MTAQLLDERQTVERFLSRVMQDVDLDEAEEEVSQHGPG
jgi:hypothetical protein